MSFWLGTRWRIFISYLRHVLRWYDFESAIIQLSELTSRRYSIKSDLWMVQKCQRPLSPNKLHNHCCSRISTQFHKKRSYSRRLQEQWHKLKIQASTVTESNSACGTIHIWRLSHICIRRIGLWHCCKYSAPKLRIVDLPSDVSLHHIKSCHMLQYLSVPSNIENSLLIP